MKKTETKEVIKTYPEKIKFKCPTRGWVEQEVTVRVFTPVLAPNPILTSEEVAELLEQFDIDPE